MEPEELRQSFDNGQHEKTAKVEYLLQSINPENMTDPEQVGDRIERKLSFYEAGEFVCPDYNCHSDARYETLAGLHGHMLGKHKVSPTYEILEDAHNLVWDEVRHMINTLDQPDEPSRPGIIGRLRNLLG